MSISEDALIAVIALGFLAGIFAHIQIITGINPTPEGVAVYALNSICHIFNATILHTTTYGQTYIKNCYSNVFWLELFITIFSVIITLAYILATGNILVGTIAYFVSFIIGFLLISV